MKIFLFLILLLLSCKSTQDFKPIENPVDKALIKKWIVNPDSGLNLRDSPSRKAKSIRLLPRGTMVNHKQLPENEKPDTIEDQKGKWLKVEIGNESGWVFDVYLSEPVFSPNGDKFYFYTIKYPKIMKIVKTEYKNCGFLNIFEMQYDCSIEIRNINNSNIIKGIIDKEIVGWYNDENLLSYWKFVDGIDNISHYRILNINSFKEKNLYELAKSYSISSDITLKIGNQESYLRTLICIFEKCFEFHLVKKENVIKVFSNSKTTFNEKWESNSTEKTLLRKFSIHKPDTLVIKALTDDQILKLKHPYTGNIEFSVDKRNYLLHVPTGKITEVKDK